MYIKHINAILCCILCFLTGMAAMLCYQQLQNDKEEPANPVVNVYVTINNKTENDAEPDDNIEIQNGESEVESKFWCYDDALMLAQMAYGEANGVPSIKTSHGERSHDYQVACTMWTVLNRVDAGWGTVQEVITAPNQFVGYKDSNTIDPNIFNLACEILVDWTTGKEALRTLPKEYLYFRGDGTYNYFRTQNGTKYDWHLPDPFI